MKTVIQLSDFHIKIGMKKPQENLVFTGLIEKLKSLSLGKIILVYNGDFIDSRVIKDFIEKEEVAGIIRSSDEREQLWNDMASEAFILAQDYFSYFTSELEISNDHIIFCCGNHDVNMYASGTERIRCGRKDRAYGNARFLCYENFLKQFLDVYRWNKFYTYSRIIDGLNFLIINSNWSNKGPEKLCISCQDIYELIEEKEEVLLDTKIKKNKCMNIFVAHAPRTDYCEEALYPYEENGYLSVINKVDDLFGLQLFGDKHTDNEHNFDYIVGAPLDSECITCGIHQFDNQNNYHHKTIRYFKGQWDILGSEQDIKQILSLSESLLKKQALKYLFGEAVVLELEKKIVDFEMVRSSKNWSALNMLFRSYITIKKPQEVGSGTVISAKDGFINTISRLISESTRKVSIIFRGGVRLGKSVCLSVLYLNLLYRFVSGTFDYMPVYINVEEIMRQIADADGKEDRNTPEYLIKVQNKVEEILRQGAELAENLQRKACCIIDGLNKYVFYPSAKIETMIAEQVNSFWGLHYAHYIYCIDTDSGLNLNHTPQHSAKDAEYVVYFNPIKTYKVNSKEKYKNFVESYCALRGADTDTADIIMKNVERMQILEIDMNLLVYFWDSLCYPENKNPFFTLLDTFVNQKIDASEIEGAAKASCRLYIEGKGYSSIIKSCSISNTTFETIRTQRLIAKYLQAKYFVNHIQEIATDLGRSTDDIALNQLYDHEICSYIRGYIEKTNAQFDILTFAKGKYASLSFAGKASISYLLGRLQSPQINSERIIEILNEEEKLFQTEQDKDQTDVDTYQMHIARRSIWLGQISVDNAHKSKISSYVKLLVFDNFERRVNRNFYLQFYGDRKIKEILSMEDVIFDGFDMYCTFHILASRLKKWLETNKDYPLLDLELFTLCDLLQVRIDNSDAVASNSEEFVPSFFYNAKYNRPQDDMAINIIAFIVQACEGYISRFENAEEESVFITYLKQQCEDYKRVFEKLKFGSLEKEEDAYNPRVLLKELVGLETTKRMGYCIPNAVSMISHEEFNSYKINGTCFETTLEHTYEMFVIGMLFLPRKSVVAKAYNKQKILNMIWIHDLGESYTGDSIPSYIGYPEDKEREKKYCERLFLQGIHAGVADMPDYLDLWNAWCDEDKSDYNIIIAKELDIIQMLYKLLIILSTSKEKALFSKKRVSEFWKAKQKIKTKEGKHIFNTIIAADEDLVHIASEYGINVMALK